MKKMKGVKIITATFLVFILAVGLCSCKQKNENEITSVFDSVSQTVTSAQTNGITESTLSEQSTEQLTQTFSQTEQIPSQTEQQTETPAAQQETVTDAVVVTGTKTITDGNKTVVYPAAVDNTQTKYPVIAWANGTGCPTQTYMSLLTELANGGYIVVADANVMAADGTSQIDSINYIINKNSDASSVFYNKVDTAGIGVCGHSQGGRSCINAAQADSRIRCVVSIAGASSADEARGLGTPCLFLTGTNDLVVVSSQWCKPSYDAVVGRAAYASLKGGIHTTCMTNPKKVSGYAISWFDAYLKNDIAAANVFVNGGTLSNDSGWQDFQNKN